MADDEVKCPLCKGHSILTREEALNRLDSQDFQDTIQGYRRVKLNLPQDAGTDPECELEGVAHGSHMGTPRRELARGDLGWGRRSPKE